MGDQGFLLPTPVSIQPRVSVFKDADRVVYVETSKMKILGIKHYRITMRSSIQLVD